MPDPFLIIPRTVSIEVDFFETTYELEQEPL